ncbi:CaiB/BaiF CoA transferase family protein [Nitriliruptor alkaliphilus]|uniref:CaiB/BaiF CoA transferase family protein n=1 Tax=Nitriliruptor alkaliphilus TaxID=427918 RepID=UPI0006963F58|nr:CoA transferase [Nitriliruptor alkaliphilus]
MPALDGVRVLDLTRVLAGPYCTMLLGDFGADVVKVEHPSGDDTRQWGPPFAGSHSTYFLATNRNKRSVALDLGDPEDLQVAVALADEADVVVQNFRAGGLCRFGLDEAAVRSRNPGVIYCSLTGYGSGAGAARPGYDFLAQAEGGLMSVTGADEPTKVGVALSDVLMGLHATIGILAALQHRTVTGRGQHVEVDLLSSTLASLVNQASGYLDAGVVPGLSANAHPSIVPYQTVQTADVPLAIAVGNDRQFRALCTGLGRSELADDPRYATNRARVDSREKLIAELEAVLVAAPAAHWQEVLAEAGVPCGQVNDVAGAFALAEELELTPTVPMLLADDDTTTQVANPVRLSATPASYRLAPPSLDQHGDAVRGGRAWTEVGR